MRDHILLHINGIEHRVSGDDVFITLSRYLREDLGATGTKVVCEEGDCGACTVLVRRTADEDFRPVNSCILGMFQMDGASIVTVEGLRMNAVQESMVAHHGAQCGYCTPGFVVAMSALYENRDRVNEKDVRDGLTGNLCRCTGYEPILKAALAVDGSAMPKLRDVYPAIPDAKDGVRAGHFAAPATLDEAIAFKREHERCTIVQGGTDVGVWVNKRAFAAPALLSLGKLDELKRITEEKDAFVAGANVSLADFEVAIQKRIPELAKILAVFGSPQIKNAGTLVGNIANGSPIGDTLPYLFVSGATLTLAGSNGTREVAVGDFYKGYKQFDLTQDEIITHVRVPVVEDTLKLYKVSRRKDLDISAFTAAFRLQLDGQRITGAQIAYGGVGPVVLRMAKTEQFLTGGDATLERFAEAGRIARSEITPITDVRGSRDYRFLLAENILSKFWWETFGSYTEKFDGHRRHQHSA